MGTIGVYTPGKTPGKPITWEHACKPQLNTRKTEPLVRFGHQPMSIEQQRQRFVTWAEHLAQQDTRLHVPEARKPNFAEALDSPTLKQTVALFQERIPTYVWTGIECSNPKVDGTRWDQLELTGFYNPEERCQQLKQMKQLGVHNVRLGLPLHRMIHAPKTTGLTLLDKAVQKSARFLAAKGLMPVDWKGFDTIYKDVKASGNRISLDIMHFGLPDLFEEPGQPEKSHFMNPQWPEFIANLALDTVTRYPDLEAVTLVNEPFVTNNFCSGLWNEKVGGDKAFVDRAFHIAKAAVLSRQKIEDYTRSQQRKMLYVHNESCEYRSNDAEFNQYKRFLTSDLILGADWLTKAPLDESNPMVRWILDKEGPAEKSRALKTLKWFKQQHQQFETRYQKPMKADTVFGIDYYVTCESGPTISHSVSAYGNEAKRFQATRQQEQSVGRKGLYEMGMDYWDRYRLPLLHTETNMGPDWQELWAKQQLVELAQLEKSGIPVLGFTWYSLLDQFGWENGLKGPVPQTQAEAISQGRLNKLGFLSHPRKPSGEYEQRPIADVITDFRKHLTP